MRTKDPIAETLADRVWTCEQCGVVNERDENAAKNIRDEAIRLVTDVPGVAASGRKFAWGAGSSGSGLLVRDVPHGRTACDSPHPLEGGVNGHGPF